MNFKHQQIGRAIKPDHQLEWFPRRGDFNLRAGFSAFAGALGQPPEVPVLLVAGRRNQKSLWAVVCLERNHAEGRQFSRAARAKGIPTSLAWSMFRLDYRPSGLRAIGFLHTLLYQPFRYGFLWRLPSLSRSWISPSRLLNSLRFLLRRNGLR